MNFHQCEPSNIFIPQWKHYIQCNGSPDPSISQEINTFISLWKEETNETFEAVTAKSKLVLNVSKYYSVILNYVNYNCLILTLKLEIN